MKQIIRMNKMLLATAIVLAMSYPALGIEYYLRAEQFTKYLPDGNQVEMWGFAQDSAFGAEDGEVNVPGPVLVVEPDDPNLIIHLDNNLSVPISIVIHGQNVVMTPVKFTDGQGRQRIKSFTYETPAGNITAVDYVWNNIRHGTFLYQSGTHPTVQVQMGLYGCLKKDALPIDDLGVASSYNIFIFENAYLSQTSSQGNIAAGSNAEFDNYEAATSLTGSNAKVVIGENIDWETGNVGGGSGYIYTGKSADLNSVGYGNLVTGGQSEVDFTEARAYLRGASSYWADMATNGTTTVLSAFNKIELTGSDTNLNIFALSGADLTSIFVLEITAPSGSTAIINIDGINVQMQNYLTVLNNIGPGHILYNLFEASSLIISSHNPKGSILAPFADISFNNGYIDGTLIGQSLGSATVSSTGEARIQSFIGDLPDINPVAYPGVFYNEDVILVFSEIDPALHDAVATDNYGPGKTVTSTIDYKPRYFLINGQPYSTGQPPLSAGKPNDKVIMRFINAGLETHVPILNDFYGYLIAEDGYQYLFAPEQYSVILPAAKTKDFLINPQHSGVYSIYDRMLRLTNEKTLGGGMFTYLAVSEGVAPAGIGEMPGNPAPTGIAVPAPTTVKGDLDGDGDVDSNDLRIFRKHWLSRSGHKVNNSADLNLDGKINRKDLIIMIEALQQENGLNVQMDDKSNKRNIKPIRRLKRLR